MDDVLLKVVDKLSEKTKSGRVAWEDVSPGLSRDRFRAFIDDVSVEVMDGERLSDRPTLSGEEVYRSYYRVLVFNPRGQSVAAEVQEEGDAHYGRLGELFDAARDCARRTGTVLEKLLTTLGK
jgi:hypothetical protein